MPYRKDRIKRLVGFTKEEWETVCQKAKAAGMRIGTYIKVMAVKGEIKYYGCNEKIVSFNRQQSESDRCR